MSGRPGIQERADVPCDGGVSPNRYKPFVSCEVRVHWPPKATMREIYEAMQEANDAALLAVLNKREELDQ